MDSKFNFELKNSFEKRKILLQLQNDLELGLISESDLTNEQVEELEKLYDEQITELNNNIQKKESMLRKKISLNNEYYKQAIELKSKIANN